MFWLLSSFLVSPYFQETVHTSISLVISAGYPCPSPAPQKTFNDSPLSFRMKSNCFDNHTISISLGCWQNMAQNHLFKFTHLAKVTNSFLLLCTQPYIWMFINLHPAENTLYSLDSKHKARSSFSMLPCAIFPSYKFVSLPVHTIYMVFYHVPLVLPLELSFNFLYESEHLIFVILIAKFLRERTLCIQFCF